MSTMRAGRPAGWTLLPLNHKVRWYPQVKARVVLALRSGKLSMEEAVRRYFLSPEELAEWALEIKRESGSEYGADDKRQSRNDR